MGIIFTGPGFLIYIVCGLWGTFICLQIIADNFGNIIASISLIIAPALLGLAPWYAGISHGDWRPLALIYGGGILATALVTIGFKIEENERQKREEEIRRKAEQERRGREEKEHEYWKEQVKNKHQDHQSIRKQ